MKLKILFIFLIMIFCISSVNAELDNTTIDDGQIAIEASTSNDFIGSADYELLQYNSSYDGEFPLRYDLRDYGFVGPVQNQGATYTCWAQATISTLESCILKATNGENVLTNHESLSVRNILEVLSKTDYGRNSVGYYTEGNFYSSIAYLSAWLGPIYNTQDPWGSSDSYAKILNSLVHVQNIYSLPARTDYTDLTAVKKAIMDYGAVYCVYYSDESGYAANKNFYTTTHTGQIDHAVTIVGWDDTVSRTEFKASQGQLPAGDGAFIVKNSYGTGWGRSGYFYVSYYDTSFYALNKPNYAWTFIFNDTLRYSSNYQYDYAGYREEAMLSYAPLWIKNTFTAAKDDNLVAFSTYFDGNYKYEAQIYVNGQLKETVSGMRNAGYYTIELDEYVPLKAGDIFEVAVRLTNMNGGLTRIYVTTKTESKHFYGAPGISQGSKNGIDWSDLYDTNYVACIKAFTSSYLFESVQTQINTAAPNSEIFLNNKTYYASTVENTITVAKNITINGAKSNGEGKSTLDGNNLFQIISINDPYTVVLKNINFINSLGNGLSVNSNVKLINCTFTNPIFIDTNGIASFENTTLVQINSKGTIASKTYLIFDNVTAQANEQCTINAFLVDEKNTPIISDKQITSNIGLMTPKNDYQYITYTPTTSMELTGNVDGFNDLTVIKGKITVENGANSFSISAGEFDYGYDAYVDVEFAKEAQGQLILLINKTEIKRENINGKTQKIKIPELNAGTYNLTIKYEGDEQLNKNTASTTLKINKITPTIKINTENVTYPENSIITIEITGINNTKLNGPITIKIDDNDYSQEITNGTLTINTPLTVGTHTAVITYSSTNYQETTKTVNFTVEKGFVELILSIKENNDNYDLIANLNKDIEGEIKFYQNNKLIGKSSIKNKQASYTITKPVDEDYTIYAVFEKTDNYNQTKSNSEKIIGEKTINLIVKDIEMYYKDGTRLNITLEDSKGNKLANKAITAVINGEEYKRTTNNNGYTSIALNLNVGKHTITVKHENITTKVTVTIKSTIKAEDIVKYYRNETQYQATILDNNGKPQAKQNLTLNINGVLYNRTTTANGTTKLSINLNPGKYTITVINKNNGEMSSNYITVLSKLNGDNVTKYFKNDTQYLVKLVDDYGRKVAGQTVTFNINGEFYTRKTNSEGVAKLNINLGPGEYIITSMYNDNYLSNTIKVLSTIKSDNIKMSTDKRTPFKVTVLDNNGKPIVNQKITLNINGVIYNRVSDATGSAILNINLAKGKYIITTLYNELLQSNTIEII